MKLNAYLNYGGNCAEAFQFYEKNLGGKITFMMRYADQPDPQNAPPGTENFILYANMSIGGTELMGSDVPADRYKAPEGFSLSVSTKDPAEAERVFNEISKNGNVIMPIQQTFWSPRFGMCTDRFGIPWMVNTEQPASQQAAHGN